VQQSGVDRVRVVLSGGRPVAYEVTAFEVPEHPLTMEFDRDHSLVALRFEPASTLLAVEMLAVIER
jgi:hypothetical protein